MDFKGFFLIFTFDRVGKKSWSLPFQPQVLDFSGLLYVHCTAAQKNKNQSTNSKGHVLKMALKNYLKNNPASILAFWEI